MILHRCIFARHQFPKQTYYPTGKNGNTRIVVLPFSAPLNLPTRGDFWTDDRFTSVASLGASVKL